MNPLAVKMLEAAGTASAADLIQACEEIEAYCFAEDETYAELQARAAAEDRNETLAQDAGHEAYLAQERRQKPT